MSPDSILKSMMQFVGKNKLITRVICSFRFTDEPRFFQYTAYTANLSKKGANLEEDNYGSSLDSNETSAQVKAIGECIERYCLSVYNKNRDFNNASYNEIKSEKIDLPMLVNYMPKEKVQSEHYITKLNNCKLNWIKCKDHFNNKEVLIPAQLIFVPYKVHELVIRNPISNGAACAPSKMEAVYKGICELIERDAFMINYLKKITPRKIDLKSIKDKAVIGLLKKFERYFLKVHILDITLDINVPTILCILIDDSGIGPAVSIGSKTDLDVNKAITGALLEAEHTRTWVRYLYLTKNSRINEPREIISLEDRGIYWCNKKQIKKLDFMLKSRNVLSISNRKPLNLKLSEKLSRIQKMIRKKGYHMYTKDLTTKEFRKKSLFVVKTIIPELHPLFLFEDLKYYYSDRIDEISKKFKLNKCYINKEPHPFV